MHVVSAQVLEQWATLTDEQVVGHVLTGQTALFEILMRRYNERLYRVARAIVRDDNEAEDVMQQAYVNLTPICGSSPGRHGFQRGSQESPSTSPLPAPDAAVNTNNTMKTFRMWSRSWLNRHRMTPSGRHSRASFERCSNGRSIGCLMERARYSYFVR